MNNIEYIRELELSIKVNEKGKYWYNQLWMYRPRSVIRKRSSGGNMASIVWRWNHPDNRRNQQELHGYPNNKLLDDLDEFHEMSAPLIENLQKEDQIFADRIKMINSNKNAFFRRTDDDAINDMLEFYDLRNFNEFSSSHLSDWENTFFTSIKQQLSKFKTLTNNQLETLQKLLVPATEKQINYLIALGFEGDTTLSKRQASNAINEIKTDGLNSHRT